MKHFILFFTLLCLAFSAHAQLNISQGETNPGNNSDQCMNIERSGSGTFYIYSSYAGATSKDNFDGLTTGDATKKRFLAAYSPQGQIKWVRGVSDEEEQKAQMTYSPTGYLFFGSTIYSGVTLFGTQQITVPTPNSSRAAICQYDTSGNFVQVTSIGKDATYTGLLDLKADTDGKVYALISTNASGDYNGLNIPANVDYPGTILLAQYSPNGTLQSIRIVGRTADFFAYYSLSFAPNHDIYIGGFVVSTTIQFNGIPIPQGASMISRWAPDGTNIWVQPLTTAANDCRVYEIETAPDGTIAFVGSITGTIQTGVSNQGGNKDALVGKMDENGNVLWSRHGEDGSNFPSYVFGVTTDSEGNIYFNGLCKGGLVFDTYGICSLDGPYDDAFIAKYYADGTYAWGDCEGGGTGYDLIVQPDNTVLSVGTTQNANGFSPVVTYLNRWRNPIIKLPSIQAKYCQEETMEINWEATDGMTFSGLTTVYIEFVQGNTSLYNSFLGYINGGSSGTVKFKLNSSTFSNVPLSNVSVILKIGGLTSGRSTPFLIAPTPVPYFQSEDLKVCQGGDHWLKPTILNQNPDLVTWSPSLGLLYADSSAALAVNVQNTKKYFVTFTNSTYQCSATDSIQLIPYQFSANIFGPTVIYQPTYQNYIAQLIGSTPYYPTTYKWWKDGVLVYQDNPYQINVTDTITLNISITDNAGCVRTDQQVITYFPPRYLRGTVMNHDSTATLPFVPVQVWKIKNQQLDPLPQVTLTNAEGRYFFKVTGIDSLLVRAIPDTLLYPTEAPTWYKRKYFIQNANRVVLMGDTTTLSPIRLHNVAMLPDSSGLLGGNIETLLAGFEPNNGPVSGLTIWIANTAGQPLQYDVTDANGAFSFDHLPFGTYRFMVDRWGIKNQLAPQVTINAEQPQRADLEGTLLPDRLIFAGISAFPEADDWPKLLLVLPNPTTGFCRIQLPNESGLLEILDAAGRVVESRNIGATQSFVDLDLLPHPAGVYQIRWSNKNAVRVSRVVRL